MKKAESIDPTEKFWSLAAADAFKAVSGSANGLSGRESQIRHKKFGPNNFMSASRSSAFILFLVQFKNPITILLVAAAFLSMGLGDFSDAFIILFIILVSDNVCLCC